MVHINIIMVAQNQVFSILISPSALKFSHQYHSTGQLKMLYSQTLKLNVQIVRVLHCEQWQLRWIQGTRNILHCKSCTRKADTLFFQHKYYNGNYNMDAIRTQKPITGKSSQLTNNVSDKDKILTIMGYRTQNKKHIYNPQNSTLQKKLSDSKLLIKIRKVCKRKTNQSSNKPNITRK